MGSLPAERRFKADSVCIIGAGPSGLAAAKYLAAERSFSRITIYEQRAVVGGLWNHIPLDEESSQDVSIPQTNPDAGLDKPLWPDIEEKAKFLTPVYERLETNIPRGLMGFSDLQWPEDCQLFPKHEDVLEYLTRYAEDVRHLITFETQVQNVEQRVDGKWNVASRTVKKNTTGDIKQEAFDAIIVANGHYAVPYIPSVSGIEAFNQTHPGIISHSKFYRKPESYTNKKVIVVGNSASGIDIGAQIAQVCALPLLQSQKSESFLLSDGSRKVEKPEITEYIPANRSVRFADGTIEECIDAILYCTGYFYSYPFLSSLDPPLTTHGERVENTYQHIFYRPNPTLAFLTLNQKVIPFPVAEAQSVVIARALSGRLALPSESEMQAWEESVVKETGTSTDFHVLKFPRDADYINMLHDWAGSADEAKAGKEPPYWDEKAYWTRERFPAIKKAFQDFGDERHSKKTLEDVGYDFEKWKAEQAEDQKLL